MKTIFFLEAASDSGSLGFSEAWPLLTTLSQHSSLSPGFASCSSLGLSHLLVRFSSNAFVFWINCTYHPAQTA